MNRSWLKGQAKIVLKKYYFILLIVSLVMAITGGSTGSIQKGMDWDSGQFFGFGDYGYEYSYDYEYEGDFDDDFYYGDASNVIQRILSNVPGGGFLSFIFSLGFGIIALLLALAGIVFTCLIAFPLHVGGARIYIDSADGEHAPSLSRFAFAFKSGHYGNVWVAGFLRSLYTFLWSLLFIIPGVIKSLAYSMVPYILADNPGMRASDAIRLSQDMMRGHKVELFVLSLSFIGWYLLGALAFGIGTFLVHPYKDATITQFYLQIRSGYLAEPIAETVIDTTGSYGGNVN